MKKLKIFELAHPTGVIFSTDYVLRESIGDLNKDYSENDVQNVIEERQKKDGCRYIILEIYEP